MVLSTVAFCMLCFQVSGKNLPPEGMQAVFQGKAQNEEDPQAGGW